MEALDAVPSPSLRGRGLKYRKNCNYHVYSESPSLRGRGLKSPFICFGNNFPSSRPLYEGVDWNVLNIAFCFRLLGRPLYEGVDWNKAQIMHKNDNICRPLYEGVDWNVLQLRLTCFWLGRPLYEGVDWNHNITIPWVILHSVALFTRAWIEIFMYCLTTPVDVSRPLYEGVDWNRLKNTIIQNLTVSPSLRGRGLK